MNETLTVTELTYAIKKQLESNFGFVSVRGEISNCKEQASGHIYFTLKDLDSQISAVLFKGNARLLSRLPKSGDQVTLQGEITVYPPKGGYQILVRSMQYSGVGDLLLKLHELKNKLQNLGWFDAQLKKPLPTFPKTIGVITSSTGSVIQDIIHILSRRFSGFHLVLNPVKVQGEGASKEIAEAIKQMNTHALADVIIVGRGGGSLEDLWAFNEEIVAKAIFESTIPIISAVGHETDHSISDLVADIRAPTPSAAAEIVTQEKNLLSKNLKEIKKRILQNIFYLSESKRHQLASITKQPFFRSPYTLLGKFYQQIDEIPEELERLAKQNVANKRLAIKSLQKQLESAKPSSQIAALKQKLTLLQKNIDARMRGRIQEKRASFEPNALRKKILLQVAYTVEKKKKSFIQLISHLRGIDPKNLLTKGYCILFPENSDSVILSIQQIELEQKVRILLHDGQITTKVQDVSIYERKNA
ncbi:MAG: exodeoxyribonuclease VII large subunit [Chlamydiae bacterium]|nr:exodeoxyribonuclease VII large subunit [Chlamydiota bacterium]